MKKLIVFILLSFLAVVVFISCSDDDTKKDKTPPVISGVRINFEDTIIDNGRVIRFNRNDEAVIDTLVTGRFLRFTARFEDDYALSSYMIKLRYDTILDNATIFDTMKVDPRLYATKYWITIFGRRDTLIQDQSDIFINDSVSKVVEGEYISLPYLEGEYFLSVYCLDKAGNESTFSYDPNTIVHHRVRVLSRETLIGLMP